MLNYIKASYKELVEKTTWPSFAELQSSTIVVMVASLIFALVVLVMDVSFESIMKGIYSFLGNIGR
jgi:preprotein translocase subunit SecE